MGIHPDSHFRLIQDLGGHQLNYMWESGIHHAFNFPTKKIQPPLQTKPHRLGQLKPVDKAKYMVWGGTMIYLTKMSPIDAQPALFSTDTYGLGNRRITGTPGSLILKKSG